MTRKQTYVSPDHGGDALSLNPGATRMASTTPPRGMERPKWVASRPAGPYQKGSPASRGPAKVTGPKKAPDNIISMEQFRNR